MMVTYLQKRCFNWFLFDENIEYKGANKHSIHNLKINSTLCGLLNKLSLQTLSKKYCKTCYIGLHNISRFCIVDFSSGDTTQIDPNKRRMPNFFPWSVQVERSNYKDRKYYVIGQCISSIFVERFLKRIFFLCCVKVLRVSFRWL